MSITISLVLDEDDSEPYIIARRHSCKYFSTVACLLNYLASTEVRMVSVRWTFRLSEYGCCYGTYLCIYI